MAGFSLRDSSTFDDWQIFQAESLRRDLAGALERLVDCHALLGQFDLAIGYARRWLALDPLHELAHRQLMQLYAWAGQRGAALHQYRECVRVLDQELGVPPLEETARLYAAIKENQIDPPAAATQSQVATAGRPLTNQPAASWSDQRPASIAEPTDIRPPLAHTPVSFVGREAEWPKLINAYTSIGSDGRLIVLEGEAGIGKTRLAAELLSHARAHGATTITGRCYEGESNLAYGPFVDALRAALLSQDRADWLATLSPHWLGEIGRLLPELERSRPNLPAMPPLDTPGAQNRFFEALSHALLALFDGAAPGVLFLDDLHWADTASLDLLAYLVRRLRGRPLCLLATWRSESMPSNHRGRAILAEAQRAGVATLLSLARLSRSAVLELVRTSALTGAPHAEELGRRLYEETEGLPFFLVEYLAALNQASAPAAGGWPVPSGVRDLLHARLAAVSETGVQLLTTAAAIGRSFDYDTLRETSGRAEEETIEALEQLIGQGLIQELRGEATQASRQPAYDFCHEKLRALIYSESSLARRRLLHRRIAETLVNRTRLQAERAARAGQIAYHYHSAGYDAAAAEYFQLAGEQARRLYANADGLAHFRAALALGHPDTPALHEAIGDLHTLLGEYSAALTSYETAAAVCLPDALARIERKLADIYRRRGEWDLAESHLRAALDALGQGSHTAQRARLYADWSLTAHRRAQPAQARDLAQQALALAEQDGDTRALVEAHNILGILDSRAGDLAAARQHLERSLTLAETLGDDSARAAALNNLAIALNTAGDNTRALALAETAVRIYAAQGDRHREAALHNNLADLLYVAGRSEDAMAHLKRAVAIFAEIGVDAGEMQPEIWKLVEW
jgi:predicted ATPase